MEVRLADYAGFCFGVNRAMETVNEQIEQNDGKKIFTYGPLIHNEEVVKELALRGVSVYEPQEEVKNEEGNKDCVMILRSHGVSRDVENSLKEGGFCIVDATCPFVKRIHRTVDEMSAEGKHIIIVGNRIHPEVEGIIGWCNEPPYVIEDMDEVNEIPFPKDEEICIVCQTTFNSNKFKEIVDNISKKGYYINVVNTICNATAERQQAAAKLADAADCMIVIGGSNSSNSRKLYDICAQRCEDTHFIQTLDDLHLELPKSVRLVGITAGASTPNNIIEEVQNYVRNEF